MISPFRVILYSGVFLFVVGTFVRDWLDRNEEAFAPPMDTEAPYTYLSPSDVGITHTLQLMPSGNLSFQGKTFSLSQLSQHFEDASTKKITSLPTVEIKVPASSAFGTIQETMKALKALGYHKVSFSTYEQNTP